MIVRLNLIFALLALIAALALTHAHFPEYCAECEQEIWEQVPCSELSTTTILPPTTTGSTPRPISSTTPAPTTARPTVPSTLPWSTTRPPIYTTPTTPSTYKKCYCECKLGCKEFCRKVSVASPKQQITQISSTGDYAPGGQIEYTHSHQRKYYPKYAAASNSYKPYPVVYSEAAAAEAASAPAPNNINAPNYTLEELAHLLSTAYGTKKGYPASPQPPPQPQPQPRPSVYYSPQPLVARLQPEYRQVINKVAAPVPRERVIIRTAAAAVSTSGRAVAKAKTPYGEVVATSAPVYESTTTYPMPPPETPKSYPAPEPEPESEPEPQPVPLPMPQTEAYPTQTEAYPDKSYETPESNSIKPESASSFDLAIDNYLKDFGYDNQVRDLGY